MFLYLFIVLAIFGIGDFLEVFTKAKLSSVFVVMILFLIGFMTGILPTDIIEQAGLSQIGKWSIGFIVFNMGTMINLKELAKESRTVITSIIAMLVVVLAGFAVMPIIGRDSAIVSIPILNGDIVATQIMTAAAMEKGMAMAAAMGTIVYAVQKFCGTPFASYFGTQEAKLIIDDFRKNKLAIERGEIQEEVITKNETFYDRHKKYYGNFTNLAITAFFVYIASVIGDITGISLSIWVF